MTSPTKSNGAPAKILLVGNNKAGAETARKAVLEEQGYEVSTATSAAEALEYFRTQNFDLAITAYRLGCPSRNGADLIAEMRSVRPELPTVIISSVAEALGLCERSTGADVVIQKNANEVAHLVRAVHRLLRRKTPKKPPAKHRNGNSSAQAAVAR